MLVKLLLILIALGNEFPFPSAFANHANHPKKLDNTFDYNNEFVYSNDEPISSDDDIPIKAGRAIRRSAWSTEAEDEKPKRIHNAQKLPIENDDPGKDIRNWDFSKLLKLVLNLMNKLEEKNITVSEENYELEGSKRKARKSKNDSKYKFIPEIKITGSKPRKKNDMEFKKISKNLHSHVFKDSINENHDLKAKDSRSNHGLSNDYEDSKFDYFNTETNYRFKDQQDTKNKKGSIFEIGREKDETLNLKTNRDVQNIKRNQAKSPEGKLKNPSIILLLKQNSEENLPLNDVIDDDEECDPFIPLLNSEQTVVGENLEGTEESNEEQGEISWDKDDDSYASDSYEVTDELKSVSGGKIKQIPVPSKVIKMTKTDAFLGNKPQALYNQKEVDEELNNSNKNIELKQRDKTPIPFSKMAQKVQASNQDNVNEKKTKTAQEVQVLDNQDEANEGLSQKSQETSMTPAIATDNFDKKVSLKQTDEVTTPFPKTARAVQVLNNQDEVNEEMNQKLLETSTTPSIATDSFDKNVKEKQIDKYVESPTTPAIVTDNSDKKVKAKQTDMTTTRFSETAQEIPVLNNQDGLNEELNKKSSEIYTIPAIVADNSGTKIKSKQTDKTTISFPQTAPDVQVSNNQNEIIEGLNQKYHRNPAISAVMDQPAVHQNNFQILNKQFSTPQLENSPINTLLYNSGSANQAALQETTLNIATPISSIIQNDSNEMVLDESTKSSQTILPYIDQQSILPYQNQGKFKKKLLQGYGTTEDEIIKANTNDKMKASGQDKRPLEGKKINNDNDAEQKHGLLDAYSNSNIQPAGRPVAKKKLNVFGDVKQKLVFFDADAKSKGEPDNKSLVIKNINNVDYAPQKQVYFETDSNSKVEKKIKSFLISKEISLADDAIQKQVSYNSNTNGENSLSKNLGSRNNNLLHDILLSDKAIQGIEKKDFQTANYEERLPISSTVIENEHSNKISNVQQEKSKATIRPQNRKSTGEQLTVISSDAIQAPSENQPSVIYKGINPISDDSISDNYQIRTSGMQKDDDQISNVVEEEEADDSYESEEGYYSSEEDNSEIYDNEDEEYITVNSSPSLTSNSDETINLNKIKNPVEKDELKETYGTILQFLYENSNNPFIQALRENSTLS